MGRWGWDGGLRERGVARHYLVFIAVMQPLGWTKIRGCRGAFGVGLVGINNLFYVSFRFQIFGFGRVFLRLCVFFVFFAFQVPGIR